MASQISHLVYANEYLEKKFQPSDPGEFLAGVVFPDIRRLSNLSRADTHQHFTELDLRMEGLGDFDAGWKFHVWCDLRRNEILRDLGFWEMKEAEEAHYLAWHFLEDEIVWDRIENWAEICQILAAAPFRKLFSKLIKTDWEYWYRIVAEYVNHKPSQPSIIRYCHHLPDVSPKTQRIIDGMEKLRKNRKVVEMLSQVAGQILPNGV